jgi:hypothetical protein
MKVALESRLAPDGSNYWSLTPRRVYEVLGLEADWYRLLDDCNQPFLFDPACFKVVDGTEPLVWESKLGEDGERYAYPTEWNLPRFFQDWHERVPEVRQAFSRGLAAWFPETVAERRVEPKL